MPGSARPKAGVNGGFLHWAMAETIEVPPAPAAPGTDPGRHWLVLVAVVAVAVALRQVVAANTDVSWWLTLSEKVLAGQQLYRDIIETNPPIPILAYLPAVLLGRALHVRAETMVDALTFAAIAASVLVSLRIARRMSALDLGHGWPFAIFSIAVLTILPMQTFGQREHLASIALLPALTALAGRAQARALPWWAIVAAGLGAAITLAFKPYFVLGIGAGIVTAAVLARSVRPLFAPEHLIAAVLVVAYGAATAIVFPDYFGKIYPMVRDVYIPMKRPLADLVASPAVVIWAGALVLALALRPGGRARAAVAVLAAESTGFAAAFLLQQKGWAYQSYPMIALSLLALAATLAERPERARPRAVVAGALVVTGALFLGGALWMNATSDARALTAPVARLGSHPKILVLSAEPSIGHPLTRAVDGEWVSSQQSLWVREFVARLRRSRTIDAEMDARLEAYERREHAMLIDDIKRNPPDVVLVDNLLGNWGDWLRADPDLGALLKSYRPTETIEHIDILTRVD